MNEAEKCKEILRPLAAQIFGHLYEVEYKANPHYCNESFKMIARRAVLAASYICAELNDIYGDE